MMKRNLLLILPILLCIIIPAVHAADWQSVETFMGTGDQNTDNFAITATEWRIRWTYIPRPSYLAGFFAFRAYEKGGQIKTLDIIKMGTNETSGTEYIHEGQKSYFLIITMTNITVASYTIIIEQDAETIPKTVSPDYTVAAVIVVATVAAVAIAAFLIIRRRRK